MLNCNDFGQKKTPLDLPQNNYDLHLPDLNTSTQNNDYVTQVNTAKSFKGLKTEETFCKNNNSGSLNLSQKLVRKGNENN